MHKIDSAGSTSDNQFTDGDPTIPVPATVVDAAWLNAVQEEICNVITGADIELDGASQNQLKTAVAAMIAAGMSTLIPTGVITMWSGATSTIPTGWALCDGTNGTPNLKNRFVVGAGGTYTVGDTGGSTTVSGTVGNTTLTQAQMPTHKHSYNFRGDTVLCQGDGTRSVWYSSTATDSGTTGSSSAHSHTFTGAADSNLPPYYALAYIIKL